MTREAVGPVFIVDEGDVHHLVEFARKAGCYLGAVPLFDGEDILKCVRLLGTAGQVRKAWSLLYFNFHLLPRHIRPTADLK